MSILFDHEYAKHMALNASRDASGEINLEGIILPEPGGPGAVRRFWRKVIKVMSAVWRFCWDSLRDSQASHNERMKRFPYDNPPMRGLW